MPRLTPLTLLLVISLPLPISADDPGSARDEVLRHLQQMGRDSYLFGQVASWVHNENPDMDHDSNWLKKVRDHTGQTPRYGCVTYDFVDDPYSDAEWNWSHSSQSMLTWPSFR